MGATESTPKRFDDEEEKVEEKNPLVSNLERRRKRKLGFIQDISSGKVYKKMKAAPSVIPSHLNKCLDWHKTKPWLGKKVKFTLMAYPSVGENPPDDIKVFFTSIPFTGTTAKERKEIINNGDGYNWFIPSKFLWSAHCFVQHQQDSHIICDVENLVRTFTDESGNTQSFIFGVVFDDESFKILDRSDYEKECNWWAQHTVATGGYGDKKMFLRTKSINSSEGEIARSIMRKRIASIFSAISTPITADNSLVTDIDQEFMNVIRSQGKNTIFDYVTHCLAILIFIKPESPLYKYTTAFRLRLVAGYYKNSAIPLLETFDMFPDFYASNKSSQDIDRVKQWIKTYHDQEIDDFFNILISSLDSTVSKLTRPRDEIFDLSDDLKPESVQEQCPDMGDTPLEDIMIYKDENNRIFCFTIDQLLDLEDDTNPLDPDGPKISPEFLYKFKKNFKPQKRERKKKTEDKCTHCKAVIDEYVLRTGSVVKSGDDLKSKVQDFCSVECLEQYKKLEELFGPEDEDEREREKDEHKDEIHDLEEKFEDEKRDLEEKYQSQLQALNSKSSDLQEKLTRAESTIRILRAGNSKAESEKSRLEESITEKERILDNQKALLQQLQDEISSKTGRDLSRLNVTDIIALMDKKDPVKDKKAAEYDELNRQIGEGRKIISQDKREITRLAEVIDTNKTNIEKYESLIRESKSIEQGLRDQISQMREKHREAFIAKSREMSVAIAERDAIITSLTESIRKMEADEAIEDNQDQKDRLASIDAMKREISIAKKEAEEKRQQLEIRNAELVAERKRISDLVRIDADAKKQFAILLSAKEKEIDLLRQTKTDLMKKLEGVPALQNQIAAYRASGNDAKLKEAESKLLLLQGQMNQNEILQSQIDTLTSQLLQEKANNELCKGSEEKERDRKRIEDLTRQITDRDVLIREKTSMIDLLASQQDKCRLNDNLTEEMEKLKLSHKEEISQKDLILQKKLDEQRREIMADMDERYKNIVKSDTLNEEQIRKRVSEMLEIEKKNILAPYKDKITIKKEELDGLMRRADDAERELNEIKPKHKKKIEEAQKVLDKELERINKLLETISMLEREKVACIKKSDSRKRDVLSLVESDVDLGQHDEDVPDKKKHVEIEIEESDEEISTPPYIPSPSYTPPRDDIEVKYDPISPDDSEIRRKELDEAERRSKARREEIALSTEKRIRIAKEDEQRRAKEDEQRRAKEDEQRRAKEDEQRRAKEDEQRRAKEDEQRRDKEDESDDDDDEELMQKLLEMKKQVEGLAGKSK
ncbi:MAG: hypothetical protein PHG66_00335 [Candidatus Colwellbacteria bacterium]|nr:hypothetical protein [Candidatus Colwellbacteria bacterium]